MIFMSQDPLYRTIEPAILQTCKQISSETTPILYSQDVIALSSPTQMLKFKHQIRPRNLLLVTSLIIWVPWSAAIEPWLALFDTFSRLAIGLKFIELAWEVDYKFPWHFEKGTE